ncbi:hypothetical protein [Pseudalkalibacillus berkeleyi]|uniref:Uncharacterized protein n=1 Tax=Pseudalkalibacillus berkeleyi TaxID=1069813 RepID=A0ABS9GUL4_9BACL|nr:hypothetical protein [Pseudalkalibacillus berkeleyi]MCF6136374.1 hypothetical protein [Pseudalkalibacillus berkeleyi]
MNIGFDRFAQIDRQTLDRQNKTYIQSFEDLCTFVDKGETVYFSTEDVYGTIVRKEEANFLITVASDKNVDRIEGSKLKLQNVYFYLKKAMFLL